MPLEHEYVEGFIRNVACAAQADQTSTTNFRLTVAIRRHLVKLGMGERQASMLALMTNVNVAENLLTDDQIDRLAATVAKGQTSSLTTVLEALPGLQMDEVMAIVGPRFSVSLA